MFDAANMPEEEAAVGYSPEADFELQACLAATAVATNRFMLRPDASACRRAASFMSLGRRIWIFALLMISAS